MNINARYTEQINSLLAGAWQDGMVSERELGTLLDENLDELVLLQMEEYIEGAISLIQTLSNSPAVYDEILIEDEEALPL